MIEAEKVESRVNGEKCNLTKEGMTNLACLLLCALERDDDITEHSTEDALCGIEIAVPPIPTQRSQKANRLKWRTAEITGQIEHLEWLTGRTCKKHGLPEPFFQPFFTLLKNAVKSALATGLFFRIQKTTMKSFMRA